MPRPKVDAVRAFAPEDPAWQVFAPQLVAAFDATMTHTYDVQGYEPKPKRRMDIVADHRVLEAMVVLAYAWPGHPMGRTPGGVKSLLHELRESVDA